MFYVWKGKDTKDVGKGDDDGAGETESSSQVRGCLRRQRSRCLWKGRKKGGHSEAGALERDSGSHDVREQGNWEWKKVDRLKARKFQEAETSMLALVSESVLQGSGCVWVRWQLCH